MLLDGYRHGVGEDVMGDLGHALGGPWLPAAGNRHWLVPSQGMGEAPLWQAQQAVMGWSCQVGSVIGSQVLD